MSMLNSGDDRALMARQLAERKPREGQRSKVYFILCQATGRVKCGVASDPRTRLASLQVGSPTPLKLVAEIDGSESKERLIHRRLERWHIHGEWFHYVPDVCDVIVDEISNYLKDLYQSDCLMQETADNPAGARSRPGDPRVNQFLMEHTLSSPGARTQSSKLYQAFEGWCRSSGATACSQKAFTMTMANAGYRRMQSSVIFFLDIRLKSQ